MRPANKVIVLACSLLILPLVTSSTPDKSPVRPPVEASSKPNATINDATPAKGNLSSSEEVIAEGGVKMKIPSKPVVSPQSHNREGVTEAPSHVNANGSKPASNLTSHSDKRVNLPNLSATVKVTTERLIPTYEIGPANSNSTVVNSDGKKIAARKGVNFSESLEQNPKPKKPTVTVASEEEPFAPSHFQSNSKSNLSASQSIPKVPNLDMLSANNQNTQRYVVPIVIVILSVPFVAILLSILYKRGSEWWRYRHYRRMDFLINGMYDN